TLLKQARAFGVGLVLSTQNPVDLDYKALSNAGTWFVGRLQTERDVDRLVEGLKSSSGDVDMATLSGTISRLPKRTFVLHSVHDPRPTLFQTRWVMSSLAGPLSRDQIRQLSASGERTEPAPSHASGPTPRTATGAERPPAAGSSDVPATGASADRPGASTGSGGEMGRPILPPHLPQLFRAATHPARTRYFPTVLGVADVHYSSKTHGVETGRRVARTVEPVEGPVPVSWLASEESPVTLEGLGEEPTPGATFSDLADVAVDASSVKEWEKLFDRWLRTEGALKLYRDPATKLVSRPDESERDFRLRCVQAVREARDAGVHKLRAKYRSRIEASDRRIMTAQQAVGREQQQLSSRTVDMAGSIIGSLIGRRGIGAAITSAARKGTTASKDLGDVQRA